MSTVLATETAKPRTKSVLKTLTRLRPEAVLIPFRALSDCRRALCFRHPLAKLSGKIGIRRFAEIGEHGYINARPEGVNTSVGVTIAGQMTIVHVAVIAAGVTVDRDIPSETLVRRSPSAPTFETLS